VFLGGRHSSSRSPDRSENRSSGKTCQNVQDDFRCSLLFWFPYKFWWRQNYRLCAYLRQSGLCEEIWAKVPISPGMNCGKSLVLEQSLLIQPSTMLYIQNTGTVPVLKSFLHCCCVDVDLCTKFGWHQLMTAGHVRSVINNFLIFRTFWMQMLNDSSLGSSVLYQYYMEIRFKMWECRNQERW